MQAADLVIEARKLSPSERFEVMEKTLSTMGQPDDPAALLVVLHAVGLRLSVAPAHA
jgi:DNA-binding phage protein